MGRFNSVVAIEQYCKIHNLALGVSKNDYFLFKDMLSNLYSDEEILVPFFASEKGGLKKYYPHALTNKRFIYYQKAFMGATMNCISKVDSIETNATGTRELGFGTVFIISGSRMLECKMNYGAARELTQLLNDALSKMK